MGLGRELGEWTHDHPTVFIYFSVKQFSPDQYIPVIRDAFDGSEFRVVIACGLEDVCPVLPESTGNVQFVRWVPLNAMMSISDIVISTGTRGTAWQAAVHGAASIMFPGTDPERDFVAQMVESAHAGIKMRDDDFSPQPLLDVTRKVYNSEARSYARRLGERLNSLGGSRRAAELLVELAEKKDNNRLKRINPV
jgi:UDP:flavonoid glycosyltransferase YjiC (YdhE family)